jgi:hypothetical protein
MLRVWSLLADVLSGASRAPAFMPGFSFGQSLHLTCTTPDRIMPSARAALNETRPLTSAIIDGCRDGAKQSRRKPCRFKAVNRVKDGKKEAPKPLVCGASVRISDAGSIRQAVDPYIG